MNTQIHGPQRPKLHWPKALIATGHREPNRSPLLSGTELRRIVAEVIG